jgi:acetylacetone-cleaving enzyme
MKQKIKEEYVQMDSLPWKPFPEAFSRGGIRWKLLHVSPEMGAWTAIFDCPKGSSFASHIHIGPGEYFLTKGRMDVRGRRARAATPRSLPATATSRRMRATTRRAFPRTASST